MNAINTPRHLMPAIRRMINALLAAALIGLPLQGHALDLDLSQIPLEVKEGVPANIILTMDDSGSMAWGFLPDSHQDAWSNHYRSSTYNKIYYNPNVTYLPGVDEYGNSLGNASFTAAWRNGYNHAQGTVDLSNNYQATYYDYRPTYNSNSYTGPTGPADYYVFDSNNTTGGVNCDSTNPAHVADDNCYDHVIVGSNSGPGRYDPDFTGCLPRETSNSACYTTDERQNFANWYSYYRIRHLLAKTATTRAFAGLSTSVRVAWQALNSSTTIADPLPLGGSHRTAFFNWVDSVPTGGGTPLTNAFWRAGQKYETAGPYRRDPTNSSSPEYSCRQNFHFAFTDGYWNSNGVNIPGNDNYDNLDHTLPTTGNSPYGNINYHANTTLSADDTPPIYRDSNATYLGDIAMYFWARDLRTSLTNDVPHFIVDKYTDIDGDGDVDNYDIFWNPKNDPAEWQHMVNFTVGLGIDGALTFNNATYQNLLNGTTAWTSDHVDDLWHAAVNSRGRYFSASSPEELVGGFKKVLQAIDDRKGSSSAVATTSSQYQSGTIIYQAIYNPSTWSGNIEAKDVLTLAPQWDAATQLASQISGGGRQIITSDGSGNGMPFTWSDITSTQQTALDTLNGTNDGLGNQRLAWLRGDDGQELKNGGPFRNRNSVLGDIVHSDPVFVPPPGPPLYFYPDDLETVTYSSYVSSNSGRTNMLLFGANDGMVHILNADTGRELLGYVPSPIYKNLSKLTDPAYNHEFYVDQPISVWDVFFNSAWHTVAIGGLGKGGQGIYALDISNPASFTETAADSVVLWEFTDVTDPDLGYTYTKPYILRMNNGKWMAAFSNGYNSTENDGHASSTGDAILFLVDVATGGQGASGVLAKLTTETGAAEDPTGLNRANRLSDITAVDVNHDFMVDYIYAGDLFGNLWKFDVTDANPTNWHVYKQGNTPTPLFVARDDSGNPQPIVTAPAVQYHQQKHGFLVFFGTGKYVENPDPSDLSLQTFYAVWDREETNITTIYRQHLLAQQMIGENLTQFASNNTGARVTTNNTMKWYDGNGLPPGANPTEYLGWRIDLANVDSNGNPILTGERIDGEIYLFANRVEFQTLVPSDNPCIGGGVSWLFALNATTGSRFLTTSPWDYNGDGAFTSADKVSLGGNQTWGSGIQVGGRMFRKTKLLNPNECQEINILNMSDGSIGKVTGNCTTKEVGRRSWRQIEIQ